jgi:hypothetical protein
VQRTRIPSSQIAFLTSFADGPACLANCDNASPAVGSSRAPLTVGPGFRGKLSNLDVAEDSTVSHINVDKSARIQAEITREIGAVAKAK